MHYTVEIEIDLPRERVFELLTDPAVRSKWQRGLQQVELLEGEVGEVGARSRLVFTNGKRKMEMQEVLTELVPPERAVWTFDAKGVHNVVKSNLVEVSPDTTRLVNENEFVFSGFMKVIGFLAKKAFPRQSLKYMQDFKAFAEQGTDVNA